MNVYQAADGRWIYFNGINKAFFNTHGEAMNMSEKVKYAEGVLDVMTDLIKLGEAMPGLRSTYTARDYAAGEADVIIDADIAETGKTAAEIEAGMTLIDNFMKFLDNDGTMVTALYRTTLNKLRSDI